MAVVVTDYFVVFEIPAFDLSGKRFGQFFTIINVSVEIKIN